MFRLLHIHLLSVSLQLLLITSGQNLYREGGFGRVYKGQLPSGQVVAVKQLDRNGLQGNREFWWRFLCLVFFIILTW